MNDDKCNINVIEASCDSSRPTTAESAQLKALDANNKHQPIPYDAFVELFVQLANVQQKERPRELLTLEDYMLLIKDHNIRLDQREMEPGQLGARLCEFWRIESYFRLDNSSWLSSELWNRSNCNGAPKVPPAPAQPITPDEPPPSEKVHEAKEPQKRLLTDAEYRERWWNARSCEYPPKANRLAYIDQHLGML